MTAAPAPPELILHATAVAIEGRGLLILGPSGAGKSGLALQLIALGARLVADDRTRLTRHGAVLLAAAPATIRGRIEARGVGLLSLPCVADVPLVRAVDLGQPEPDRLPHPHHLTLLGLTLPCLRRVEAPHFAAALFLSLAAPQTHDPDAT